MDRYLLFRGRNYYPSGGMNDFIGDYPTIESAIEASNEELLKDYESTKSLYDSEEEYIESEKQYNWGHIFDTETRQIVWEQS